MYLVQHLYEQHGKYLGLDLIAGRAGLSRRIHKAEVHRPGLSLTGFLKGFATARVLVIGKQENEFLKEQLDAKRRLMEMVIRSERPLKSTIRIDPGSLVPFYEAIGLSSFQCFYADWYPGNEMGNVYLSGIDYTISDFRDRKSWVDQKAFPTFLDWLAFFLEGNSID